jgi:hypothetical protein
MAKKHRVWLSYDLGLRGDYESLYEWLDEKGAEECGDSIATFITDRSRDQLRDSLAEILSESPKARIYIVSMAGGGKFIFGRRKAAPWTGSFQTAVESALDQ